MRAHHRRERRARAVEARRALDERLARVRAEEASMRRQQRWQAEREHVPAKKRVSSYGRCPSLPSPG